MNACAAVMTGRGVGAIATVCVIGEGASDILKSIFKPTGKNTLATNEYELTQTKSHQPSAISRQQEDKPAISFEVGKILLGNIVDGEKVIDQVVVGCEGENEFAINCHGNPLIVELIMELLAKHGAEAVKAEQLIELQIKNKKLKIKNEEKTNSLIVTEAKIAQLKARTIDGYKLLENQINGGLPAKIAEWSKIESLEQIQKEATEILKANQAAQYLIHGCKVVLAGPANSGKSTLLNCLAGKEKSIVADIPGTTRDWVSAHCISGNLAMEIFDTAGLDESLTTDSAIDTAAQERSVALIEQADIVLWVIDGNDEKAKIKNKRLKIKNQIVVINKSDLGLKTSGIFENTIVISAKNGTGIDELTKKVRTVLGVEGFYLKQAVCFTERQQQLLQKIAVAKDRQEVENALVNLNQ